MPLLGEGGVGSRPHASRWGNTGAKSGHGVERCPALLGGCASRVHGVSHFVEAVLEEVTVGVGGHRGGGSS